MSASTATASTATASTATASTATASTATATTATTATAKGATMAQVKGAMPQFFALSVAHCIKAMSDKTEARAMLARALTGAALERAQSGNCPALNGADSALDALKGKARQHADNALSIVRAIKARALAAAPLADYEAFANESYSQILEALTPAPVAPKAKAPAVNWKARAEAAEAAHAILLAYAEALRQAVGNAAPAIPVGALIPAIEPATA